MEVFLPLRHEDIREISEGKIGESEGRRTVFVNLENNVDTQGEGELACLIVGHYFDFYFSQTN